MRSDVLERLQVLEEQLSAIESTARAVEGEFKSSNQVRGVGGMGERKRVKGKGGEGKMLRVARYIEKGGEEDGGRAFHLMAHFNPLPSSHAYSFYTHLINSRPSQKHNPPFPTHLN